ncbi:neuraminidase-like domain-containing protein [Arthrobacter sp. ok909]|uniref:Tc toxin subunit A-related protein n=1 Tax=Arthrobacter sp. ok909 TaxID=1761746 RepID=UPI00111404C3|nr:neuraminidase-like domain-containing protein [Arthrobacter sp. ok909]
MVALVAVAPGSTGATAANLQQLLLRLDIGEIPADELQEQRYGQVTRRLVYLMQQQLGLQPPIHGEVDAETARAVNDFAFEQEIFNIVEGTVRMNGGHTTAHARIRVMEAENMGGLECADTQTNSDGHYLAWYDPEFYAVERPGVIRRTDHMKVVVHSTGDNGDEVSSAAYPDPERLLTVDLTFPPSELGDLLRVRGHVADASGAHLPQITVEVMDREIGTVTQSLGICTTDDSGAFEVTYRRAQYLSGEGKTREKSTADLLFRLEAGDPNAPLADFTVTRLLTGPDEKFPGAGLMDRHGQLLGIRARDDELVHLTVQGLHAPRSPSEFERLLDALSPLTALKPVEEFDESRSQDISFAAREIGEERRLVEDLVTAHKLALDPFEQVFPAAVFYGLARVLGVRDVRSLAAHRVEELATALEEAHNIHNWVPKILNDPAKMVAEIHATAVRHALNALGSSENVLDQVLGTVIQDPQLRSDLAAASVNHVGPPELFWTQTAVRHPELPIPRIQYTLQLATLANNSVPLITAIQQHLPEITSMRTLALELDEDRLTDLVEGSGALPSTRHDGESDADARIRLSNEVRGLLEATQPTSIVARLTKTWAAVNPAAVPVETAELMDRAVRRSEFDLGTSDVGTFVTEHADLLFDHALDSITRKTAVEGLMRVQRLFRVSAGPETVSVLAVRNSPTGLPFQGAVDIARYGKEAFLAHFAEEPLQMQSSLGLLHDRARMMADTMSGLMIAHHQDAHGLMPAAVMGRPATAPVQQQQENGVGAGAPPDKIPSWTDFFGSTEQCECDECRSVTGQAAYLVDLFEFLDKRCRPDLAGRGTTPLDHLIGHATKKAKDTDEPGIRGLRPDLAHIKLTCQNVNTTIPTIDLINEILESVVFFNETTPLETDAAGDPVSPPHLHPNEPSQGVTGRELSAAPEHVLEQAYRILSQAVYPVGLPYDRLLNAARLHFRQAGTSRAETLSLFTTGSQVHVAMEMLGLLRRDFEILTDTTVAGGALSQPIPVETLFGFPPNAPGWMNDLATTRKALQVLGLSFADLVALLRTRFIGGLVPDADDPGTAAHLLIDVDQLTLLRGSNFIVEPDSPISEAMDRGGLIGDDVKAFVDSYAGRLSATIVLDPPLSCDPQQIRLRHLDGSSITESEWLRLHQFVRLARRMGIAMADLDVALSAVGGDAAAFNGPTLQRLGDLARLRESLNLTWPVAAALVSDIDVYGSGSLYDQLFIRSGLARAHSAFRRIPGATIHGTGAPLEACLGAMSSAFGAAAEDLRAAADRLGLTQLRLAEISELHRISVLAGSLGVSPVEIVVLRDILGNPGADPGQVQQFVGRCRNFLGAGLSTTLLMFLTGSSPTTDSIGRSAEELAAVLTSLASAIASANERDARELIEETESAAGDRHLKEAELDTRRTARELNRHDLTAAVITASFSLDPTLVNRLFASIPSLASLQHDTTPEQHAETMATLQGIDRISQLVAATKLPSDQFDAVLTTATRTPDMALGAIFEGADTTVILAIVEDLGRFAALAGQTRRPTALAGALTSLALANGQHWPEATISAVSGWLRIEPDLVKQTIAIGTSVLVLPEAGLHPLAALSALHQCTLVARRIGCPAHQIPAMLSDPVTAESLSTLVRAVSAGYPVAEWMEVSRQLTDPVREASRDALVDYLVHRDRLDNADQLFNKYLVDTQINPFVLSSRIRQAIFAVHAYVPQCLLGQVKGVAPEQINVDEWQSLKREPVRGALLEALLYPEWLLNPAWRDNKSRLFKETEAKLRQLDVTPANVMQVCDQFLSGMSEVSSVEVCGSFLQTVFAGKEQGRFQSMLHVVGRTRSSQPQKYFYRRLNQYQHSREWTSWEPIGVDIQGVEQDRASLRTAGPDSGLVEPGVHVLPVMWRDQIHLFWPTFVRRVEGPKDPPDAIDATSPKIQPVFSRPYWDVKLCWTRREADGWGPKQQSTALAETWWPDNIDDLDFGASVNDAVPTNLAHLPEPHLPAPNTLVLQALVEPDRLNIGLAERTADGGTAPRFSFSFDREASEMRVHGSALEISGDHPAFNVAKGISGSYLALRVSGDVYAVASPLNPKGDLLFAPAESMRITTLNQGFGAPLKAPLFLDLGDSVYFATPQAGTMTVAEAVMSPPGPWLKQKIDIDQLVQLASATFVTRPGNPWMGIPASHAAAFASAALQSAAKSVPSPNGAGLNDQTIVSGELILPSKVAEWLSPPAIDLTVSAFSHPFVDKFRKILRRQGLESLLSPATQQMTLDSKETFRSRCSPNPQRTTVPAVEGIDFAPDSPWGNENWELFFHLACLIRTVQKETKQFEACMKTDATYFDFLHAGSDPADAWRFEPLREAKALRLEDLLATLNRPDNDPERQMFEAQIEAMRLYPFQSHRIARLRPLAYKKWAVIEAVRLQLAISEEFHAQFPDPEAVNRAFQPALLASALLGPRPELMRPRVSMAPRSYAELRPDLDSMGNVMLTAESKLAPAAPITGPSAEPNAGTVTSLVQHGAIGYFGIPPDRKLLALWDEVEDRLFKLRNSMNLDGVQIQLPLYPPRIDPAVLAEAVGSGLDLGTVLSALAAPRPPQRFSTAYREAVADVQLLISISDLYLASQSQLKNETLAMTRAAHEKAMADMVLGSLQKQIELARRERDDLLVQREGRIQLWEHYRELLGLTAVASPKKYSALGTASGKDSGIAQPSRPLSLVAADQIRFEDLQIIPGVPIGLPGMATGMIMAEEAQELRESFEAVKLTFEAAQLESLGAVVGIIPNFEAAAKPMGAGAAVHLGGQALAAVARAAAGNKNTVAGMHRFLAQMYGKQASLVLRERDWTLGLNQAARSVIEIDQKMKTLDIKVSVEESKYAEGEQKRRNDEEIEAFLHEQFPGTQFWEQRAKHLDRLFMKCCDLALESANGAAVSYRWQREPSNPPPPISASRPKNAREGLLVGHQLMTSLQEMNRRFQATEETGPHIVRTFSLNDVDPWALYYLREEGRATFSLPEVLFDLDHPGHYNRRIESVRVSVLCTTSPLSGVSGTLTLTKSYRRQKPNGDLVLDTPTGTTSIALSTGRDDTGVSEKSLQGDLYRPFEGLGAVSDWELVLPAKFRKFNYREIFDVHLTMECKASNSAGDRTDTITHALNVLTSSGAAQGPYRLISLRHDRPDEWATYRAGKGIRATISTQVLPYILRHGTTPKLQEAVLIRLPKDKPADSPGELTISGHGPDWTVEPAANHDVGDPADTDDILLVTRFQI